MAGSVVNLYTSSGSFAKGSTADVEILMLGGGGGGGSARCGADGSNRGGGGGGGGAAYAWTALGAAVLPSSVTVTVGAVALVGLASGQRRRTATQAVTA